MLSNAAFNALLKILEEPPEHLIFILATTELHKVPATILSRCQRFSFKRLSPAAIASRLSLVAGNENLALTPDAAEKLASLADGSMRDGLSLLDQCASDTVVDLQRVLDTVGLAGQAELLRLAGVAADRDISGALGILERLYDDGRDMASLLNELASLMRDLLLYKLSKDSPLLGGGFSGKELSVLSKKLTPERLLSCLEVIREALFGLSRGGSVKLAAEMCLIRICDERLSDDTPAMLARIAKLEQNQQYKIIHSKPQEENEAAENEVVENNAADGAASAESSDEPGQAPAGGADVAVNNEPLIDPAELVQNTEDNEHLSPTGSQDNGVIETEMLVTAQPHHPQTTIPQSGGASWQDILAALKSEAAVYALLSDSAGVQAEMQGDALVIRANNLFTVSLIEMSYSELLRDTVRKVLGREVAIRVETGIGSNGESKREKLERLNAFDIIEFE